MKKIIINSILILSSSTVFISCLKDKEYDDSKIGNQDIENVAKIIEIPNSSENPVVFALNTLPATEEIDAVEVNLATGQVAEADITVTLVKNNTLLANYNSVHGTSFEELPTSNYILPAGGLAVTIPKGKNKAYLKLNLQKSSFDFSKSYALGYSIATISPSGYTISQNYKNILVSVGLKNKYDGAYTLTGYHNRVPFDFPYIDVPMELHTSGPSNIRFFWNEASAYGHPIGTGPGALGWYGTAIGPALSIDPATNNITGATNLGGATVIDLDPSVITHRVTWNAATNKPDKIYVTWRYSGNQLRRFFDTLTYVGPR